MICLFIWKLNNLILTSCHFIPEIRKKYSLRINQRFRLSYFRLSSPSLWRWRRRPKSRRQSSRRPPLVSETREDIIRHTRTTHIHCTDTTLCRTHTLHTAITVILPIILTTTTIILTTISSKRWNPRWLGINTGTRRTSHGNLITSWKPHYFMKMEEVLLLNNWFRNSWLPQMRLRSLSISFSYAYCNNKITYATCERDEFSLAY